MLRNAFGLSKRLLFACNQQLFVANKNYCASSNGPNANLEPKIEPVSLSYNSYEDVVATKTAAPVIIMHGLFGSKQNWRSICKSLNQKSNPTRKVYAVDARNHGESPHSPNHRYEDLAEDVHQFYREHNIDKAIVVGHSMGGRAMMTFTLKYPELVEKAIIVDVSPVTTSPALKNMGQIFAAMHSVKVESGLSLSEGRASANAQITPLIPDQVTRDFILLNFFRADDGSFKWRANVSALHTNFNKYISRFPETFVNHECPIPTLFIGGKNSDYLTYQWRVNRHVLEQHRSFLVRFPEYLRANRFDGPILLFGGTRSTQLHESQIPEIKKTFPRAEVKFLNGGHNIGISESRGEFLKEAVQFINHQDPGPKG